MRALLLLTAANIKSFTRDRAALFWTLAFPLIFIFLFGSIFSGGNNDRTIGFADLDKSTHSAELQAAFASQPNVKLIEASEDDLVAQMRDGKLSAVLVVPAGFGATIDAKTAPATIKVYTDPAQTAAQGATFQLVGGVLGAVNQAASGRPPAVTFTNQAVQTQDLTFISYLVPSILGMSLMQLGIFSAIPLVADRQKHILKRLQATPLRRWQLVGSNVLMRLIIAVVQTVIIVGVGATFFHVEVSGNWLTIGLLVVLGSLAFIALGYVIASFASTEESANGMTSVVQFPLMFLSGTFFPIDSMPDALRTVARALPLTYLGDALRQVMVGGTAFSPLWLCVAFLVVWLVVCFAVAARFFRWQ
ncbi:MAG TPA: ABC transporter permease [Methylomirabilota bacterium]|jgi:ABC-2 type transport system permease protein|nr:ABC transporter permease [Methylomirabilota bacterium]